MNHAISYPIVIALGVFVLAVLLCAVLFDDQGRPRF